MEAVDEVEIDKEGKFKYILVKVWPATANEEDPGRLIVRGTAEAEFHPDIMAKVKLFVVLSDKVEVGETSPPCPPCVFLSRC